MPHNPGGILNLARPTLLLTRPEAQSRHFATIFRARFGADWPVVLSPLTTIQFLDPGPLPNGARDLIFTSQNAVLAYARLTGARAGKAWCVGKATEAAAQAAGFETCAGPGDGAGLAKAIKANGAGRTFVYPRPVHAARDVAAELNSAGIDTVSLVVYDQVLSPPTAEAQGVMQAAAPVLMPLFSPRSARAAGLAFRDIHAPLYVAALSDAVAEASGLPARYIATAAEPIGDAMLDALGALIDAANTA